MTPNSHFIEKVKIEVVEELPPVNLTDNFLVSEKAKASFLKEKESFFPVFMEKCFWPKALSEKTGGRIYLFKLSSAGNQTTMVHVPSYLSRDITASFDEQKGFAKRYIGAVESYVKLCKKLTKDGRVAFGLSPDPNIIDCSDIEDLIYALTLNKNDKRYTYQVLRMFCTYLMNKHYVLWPVKRIPKEKHWANFTREFGYPFGGWCLDNGCCDKSRVFRILRATKWTVPELITDKDVRELYEKIQQTDTPGNNYSTALNEILKKAIKSGCKITYTSHRERLSSKTRTGRLDGSFSYYDKYLDECPEIGYWTERCRDYCSFEKGNGRQELQHPSLSLARWIDYLLYLHSQKIPIPINLREVKRLIHVAATQVAHHKRSFIPFSDWLVYERFSQGVRHQILSILRSLFIWIMAADEVDVDCPVRDIDIPSSRQKPNKTHRPALTMGQWVHIRDIILSRAPKYYEILGYNDRIPVTKESPILKTYALSRLELGIRDAQARYLDMHNILGPDGFVITGDKNINRKYLQVIPYFDDDLKKQIEECILWQETNNVKTDPVWYCDNDNSPFGRVHPLLRKIGLDPKPVSNSSTRMYMMKLLLQYQKEAKLSGRDQIVLRRDGSPIDMNELDIESIKYDDLTSTFKTSFDLHSLRVTAATIWYEAGVPLEIIQEFITGHATLTMLLHYVRIRNADAVMKDAFERLIREQEQIRKGLGQDIEKTIDTFALTSLGQIRDDEVDGIESLKNTPGSFWRFFHYGICPTGACPKGLDGRCGLCPLLISGPSFKAGLTVQFNMVVSQALVIGLEIKNNNRKVSNKEAIIQSLVQEMAGWITWLHRIDKIEQERVREDPIKLTLYSQGYNPHLVKTSPLIHELQRCVDIVHCPEVWTENTYQKARTYLMTLLSKLPSRKEAPFSIVSKLAPEKVCGQIAKYFLKLMKTGMSFEEIEMIFSRGDNALPFNNIRILNEVEENDNG